MIPDPTDILMYAASMARAKASRATKPAPRIQARRSKQKAARAARRRNRKAK